MKVARRVLRGPRRSNAPGLPDGATADTAHYLEDGSGRELAYVALSRARQGTSIYVEADDLDQAAEDLSINWTNERRQEWVIDQHRALPQPSCSVGDGIGIDLW